MRNKELFKSAVIIAAVLLLAGCGNQRVNNEKAPIDSPTESTDEDFGTSAEYDDLPASVEYEDIPQTLTELEGYRPYVIRFFLNGEPSNDFVPYFHVDEGLRDMEEAENLGYIKNIQAYTADGVPCDLMTVVDKDSGKVRMTHNAVFVFYVKEDAEMFIFPASSHDLMQFYGNLTDIFLYYEAAEVEQKGFEAPVMRYRLNPDVDFNEKGTVKLLDCELDPYRTRLWDGNAYTVEHYFYFYKNFIETEKPAGPM